MKYVLILCIPFFILAIFLVSQDNYSRGKTPLERIESACQREHPGRSDRVESCKMDLILRMAREGNEASHERAYQRAR